MPSIANRCLAVVYHRDTYRRTGGHRKYQRVPGFEMHYTRSQCKRAAKEDGLCGQHAALDKRWHTIQRVQT